MTCNCPKCSFQIEFDSADLPAEGSFNKCAECGTNFAIRKELFALRALHKGDQITCAECGSNPGASIYCQNCHAMYPDFLVIETSSAAKRQIGKLLSSFNVLKNLKIGGAPKVSADSYAGDSFAPGKAAAVQPPRNSLKLLLASVVILALAVGGGFFWHQEKEAEKYSDNYVRALLCIQLARGLNIKMSTRLVADMKTGTSAALTPAEQKSAVSAKNDVDALMKRLDKVPAKFTSNNDALKKLHDAYSSLHATVTAPPGTSDVYSASVKNSDAEFKKTAAELKSGLPEKISAPLAESSKKFKALQDL